MTIRKKTRLWRKEAGARVEGSRALDSGKVQAPCVIRIPSDGFRLFYTAVGPGKPFSVCQGYILSAVSDDGLVFRTEPGIRLAPQPDLPHSALRVLAPTVTECPDGRWRMYVESRGRAGLPTVICSATSDDMLEWKREDGIRLQSPGGMGGPRFLALGDGRGRLYCINSEYGPGGPKDGERLARGVVSAVTDDGLHFELEPGYRMQSGDTLYESGGITAAQVIPPETEGDTWTLIYSAWQDVSAGTSVPVHPSSDPDAVENGLSENFAVASIASDMAGYRSRIFEAHSTDGVVWERGECIVEGGGYDARGIDAVHAEDMSVIKLGDGVYRMYYAACDSNGNWRVASAITDARANA